MWRRMQDATWKQAKTTLVTALLVKVLASSDEKYVKRKGSAALLKQVESEKLPVRACLLERARKAMRMESAALGMPAS